MRGARLGRPTLSGRLCGVGSREVREEAELLWHAVVGLKRTLTACVYAALRAGGISAGARAGRRLG